MGTTGKSLTLSWKLSFLPLTWPQSLVDLALRKLGRVRVFVEHLWPWLVVRLTFRVFYGTVADE